MMYKHPKGYMYLFVKVGRLIYVSLEASILRVAIGDNIRLMWRNSKKNCCIPRVSPWEYILAPTSSPHVTILHPPPTHTHTYITKPIVYQHPLHWRVPIQWPWMVAVLLGWAQWAKVSTEVNIWAHDSYIVQAIACAREVSISAQVKFPRVQA